MMSLNYKSIVASYDSEPPLITHRSLTELNARTKQYQQCLKIYPSTIRHNGKTISTNWSKDATVQNTRQLVIILITLHITIPLHITAPPLKFWKRKWKELTNLFYKIPMIEKQRMSSEEILIDHAWQD